MKTVTVRSDDEFNADTFWAELDLSHPEIAESLRAGDAVVDAKTWESIQSLAGFYSGPSYGQTALVIVVDAPEDAVEHHGTLCDYDTGEFLRAASAEERAASGVINVDGRRCHVIE